MPLMRYFGLVGSALLLLLFGSSWLFPQTVPEPLHPDTDRPVIRITSVQKLPERVDIDTSLPTIAPFSPPTMESAERRRREVANDTPKAEIADEKPLSRSVSPIIIDGPKPRRVARLQSSKRLASSSPVPSTNRRVSSSHAHTEAPFTRMSLLDIIKDHFGHSFFELN